MRKSFIFVGGLALLASLILSGCSPAPVIETKTSPETKPVEPPSLPEFTLQPFHVAMEEGMKISFEQADEIVLGLYSGSRQDETFGLIHYFDDFQTFDKTTLSWSEKMQVIMQVQEGGLKPQIIKKNEFGRLSDLDQVGICWDPYEGSRFIYLCEGQKMLIFLQTGYDEIHNQSYRNLIDAYPVTDICQADTLFNSLFK